MTKTQIAIAQTGCTVELGNNRTLEIFEKYGVEYAIIYTPFGVEYYGPLEDLGAWSPILWYYMYMDQFWFIQTKRENSNDNVYKISSNNYSYRVHWSA